MIHLQQKKQPEPRETVLNGQLGAVFGLTFVTIPGDRIQADVHTLYDNAPPLTKFNYEQVYRQESLKTTKDNGRGIV